MISFPMPFYAVPCSIWLARHEDDEWGNEVVSYNVDPDVTTSCCYAPGRLTTATTNDIEDGRPYGAEVDMTFYLPKSVDADLRGALIACYPPDDMTLSGAKFEVVGKPHSYPRADTPGNYSWCVEGVTYLG